MILLLLFLLIPAPVWAAITSIDTNTATTGSLVSGNTLAVNVTDTMVVDRVGLFRIVSDNFNTTDADHNEHTGVTDTVGNTYSKLCEATNGEGAAAAGITGSLWLVRITTQLTAGQTINITFANSITARVAIMHEFSVTSGNTLEIAAGSGGCNVGRYDAIDVGSQATTAVASASTLWYRPIYIEGATNNVTTPTTNFTAMAVAVASTGADGTSASTSGEFRIFTATDQTSDPLMADTNDTFVTFFVALREVSATPATTRRRASPVEIN